MGNQRNKLYTPYNNLDNYQTNKMVPKLYICKSNLYKLYFIRNFSSSLYNRGIKLYHIIVLPSVICFKSKHYIKHKQRAKQL